MLITGDTAPDRLREAQESGLLLLHKPVSNSRLRAAITHLMARHAAIRSLVQKLRCLRPVDHVQRLEDRGDVHLHGLLGDAEVGADLLVGEPVAQVVQHVDLAIGELRQRTRPVTACMVGGTRRRAEPAAAARRCFPTAPVCSADTTVCAVADFGM